MVQGARLASAGAAVDGVTNLSRWPEADRVLDEALALEAGKRLPFLRRVTAGDVEYMAALELVLGEAERDDEFLRPGGAISDTLAAALEEEDAAEEALPPGFRIGDYIVVGSLGRGGMGSVYRARDTKLDRDVALKVLPARFARDPERLARFREEARVLASLSHPNIGSIHGLVEEAGVEALVLELVEGPTLQERIADGPMELAEALVVARAVGEALDAAHRRGIVHRDLKPANVKRTEEGTVKVLDFGLARPVKRDAGPDSEFSPVVTRAGLIVGTPAYMSPEQARRLPVDQRADIWAFGCLLYEMLAGRRAFQGQSTADVIAQVIEHNPDFDQLPPGTPEPVVRLLRRCFERDPMRRPHHLGEVLLEIDKTLAPPLQVPGTRELRPWRLAAAGTTLFLALLATTAALVWQAFRPPSMPVTRAAIPLPPDEELVIGAQPLVALSPDGRVVFYRARRDGVIQLFRRSLDTLHSIPVPGTENATAPFFSPDGRWLAFDGDGVLKKMAAAGGTAAPICDAPGGATGSWGPGGTIVFSTATGRVLQRVDANGGSPVPISQLDGSRGEVAHAFPEVLPDGRTVLFTIVSRDTKEIAALRMDTGEIKRITPGTQPRLLPTGHLVFVRDGTLSAAPFDSHRLALRGEPVSVLEDRLEETQGSIFYFATAGNGSLVYVPRRSSPDGRILVWLDRSGRETPAPLPQMRYFRASLSPDGTKGAISVRGEGQNHLWIADLASGKMSRLSVDASADNAPVWSPDGRYVVYRSDTQGGALFRRAADGTGAPERLTSSDGPYHTAYSWTADGSALLFTAFHSYGLQSIMRLTIAGGLRVETILEGEFAQSKPQLSPDGRWLAYQSDESGRFEVYVRPYPEVGSGRWQVSTAGGTSPRWARNGRELFYYDGAAMMAVPTAGHGDFTAGEPRPLFRWQPFMGRLGPDYDVSAEGRFLMIGTAPPSDPVGSRPQLVLVQNWFKELEARAGYR
jgi:eukaryotic-like serine/threonine-protein kinase